MMQLQQAKAVESQDTGVDLTGVDSYQNGLQPLDSLA